MIAVTGATGNLGKLIINQLLKENVSANEIIALVRNTEKAKELLPQGIEIREFDYNKKENLGNSLTDIDTLMLVSSSEVGKRIEQHKNVIEAAKKNKIKKIVYTSILKATTSPLGLAPEHKETEKMILESGVSYTILRNGWYTENYLGNLTQTIEQGSFSGCAGNAKFSTASREDYARAATKALLSDEHNNKIYELAGDTSFTLKELAEKISQISNRNITYIDQSEKEYTETLITLGVPAPFAEVLASTETLAKEGWLYDNSQILSKLINTKTTSLEESIGSMLK